jgi:hypothetical protein
MTSPAAGIVVEYRDLVSLIDPGTFKPQQTLPAFLRTCSFEKLYSSEAYRKFVLEHMRLWCFATSSPPAKKKPVWGTAANLAQRMACVVSSVRSRYPDLETDDAFGLAFDSGDAAMTFVESLIKTDAATVK